MMMNWDGCDRSWLKYWVVFIHEQQLEFFNEQNSHHSSGKHDSRGSTIRFLLIFCFTWKQFNWNRGKFLQMTELTNVLQLLFIIYSLFRERKKRKEEIAWVATGDRIGWGGLKSNRSLERGRNHNYHLSINQRMQTERIKNKYGFYELYTMLGWLIEVKS